MEAESIDRIGSGPKPSKLVVMVAFEGACALDIVGPLDLMSSCALALGRDTPEYAVEIATSNGGPVRTAPGGIRLLSRSFDDFRNAEIDTLMVAGGFDVSIPSKSRKIIEWVANTAPQVRRVASVCTGAFILAEAGILSGRRATTHWHWADDLARDFPDIIVEPDSIYVRDGNVYTSAGITAGMDLALALIEEDYGSETALSMARHCVMFLKRPGGQSQFSSFLPRRASNHRSIHDLQGWMMGRLNEELSVQQLAERMGMSARNFTRLFVREVGTTPGKFVQELRLHAAQQHLQGSSLSIETVAIACGFGNAERMRRTFLRRLRVNPHEYRSRFQSGLHTSVHPA